MSHIGIAVDHPLNAQIIAALTARPSEGERLAAIRSLEETLAQRRSPVLEKSLQKLRDNKPDPPLAPSQSPEGVDMMSLGARPEIVEDLWRLGRALPTDCRWVAYRRAVLAHSRTGIIFGLAVGTFGIVLRLPEDATPLAEAAGGTREWAYKAAQGQKTFSALKYGPDWWLFRPGADASGPAGAAYDWFGAS
jgi:hypothetical protein